MDRTAKHFRKRDAILTCLRSTTAHPSAEWVYRQLMKEDSDISLATVYRNLAMFKSQGIIASLGIVDGTERFDGNTAPHAHYICTCCGEVMDLEGIPVPEELNTAAARYSGGKVTGCQLTFTGICGLCNQKNN